MDLKEAFRNFIPEFQSHFSYKPLSSDKIFAQNLKPMHAFKLHQGKGRNVLGSGREVRNTYQPIRNTLNDKNASFVLHPSPFNQPQIVATVWITFRVKIIKVSGQNGYTMDDPRNSLNQTDYTGVTFAHIATVQNKIKYNIIMTNI